MRSINLGFLIIASLVIWKIVDIIQWALSADWKTIFREWFD